MGHLGCRNPRNQLSSLSDPRFLVSCQKSQPFQGQGFFGWRSSYTVVTSAPSSSFLSHARSVHSQRNGVCRRRAAPNCRHFWTLAFLSRVKRVNSHSDAAPEGRHHRNCSCFWTRVSPASSCSVRLWCPGLVSSSSCCALVSACCFLVSCPRVWCLGVVPLSCPSVASPCRVLGSCPFVVSSCRVVSFCHVLTSCLRVVSSSSQLVLM